MSDTVFALGLSGLQDFVYDVEAEDAARRLRIRSAILTLAPALVASRLRQLTQPGLEPYYLGGGQLLTSCSSQALSQIEPELRSLQEWLLVHSAGRILLYWTSVPRSDDVKNDLQEIIRAVLRAKWQSGRHQSEWLAQASRLDPLDPNRGALGDPQWEAHIGRELVRAGGFTGFRLVNGGDGWPVGPWMVQPVSDGECDIRIQQGADDRGIVIGLPTHVPTYQTGDIIPFDQMAAQGTGASYLAALKLDGDHMGKSMAAALAQSADEYLSRSRAVRAFFAVTVPRLFRDEFPNVYLIYSGGDDLAAVGHFHDLLRAAYRINQEYSQQGLGTLSAGITAFHRKSPVRLAMDVANNLLEGHAKKDRNRVCVFGETLTWDQLDVVIREAEVLAQSVEQEPDGLPRGMLQLLMQLDSLYTSQIDWLKKVRFRAFPLIQYFRARRLKAEGLSTEAATIFYNLEGGHDPTWNRIGLVALLAAWLTKPQENE